MSITAYGYTCNCEIVGIPFRQAITSMLEVCDEVIIIDAGSVDGTYDELKTIDGLQLVRREYDFDSGTADSDMKRQAREMVKTDLCWGLDVDEVLHEKDYKNWRDVIYSIGEHDMLILPQVCFWTFDLYQLRHGYHTVHKNHPNWTVGIPKSAQQVNPTTGRVIVKGMHYEYVDTNTGEIPERNIKWIPNEEILTVHENPIHDKPNIATQMRDYIVNAPAIYHYCWADIFRKRLQQSTFDNHQNRILYGELNYWSERFEATNGFPSFNTLFDSINYMINYAHPYLVPMDKEITHPVIMSEWIEKYSDYDMQREYDKIKEYATRETKFM